MSKKAKPIAQARKPASGKAAAHGAKPSTKSKAMPVARSNGKPKPIANGAEKHKRVSALDAAATVLKKAGKPLRSQEMIEAMAKQGLWTSPNGKTPHATLYAAIIREIAVKGKEARFRKVERGQFATMS